MEEYESKDKFDRQSALKFIAEAGQSFARMADDLAKTKLPKREEHKEDKILIISKLIRRISSLEQEMKSLYGAVNNLFQFY